MKGDALDRILVNLRPESALAAMAAVVGLTLLGGYLYGVGPSLAMLRKLDTEGSQAALANLTSELAQADTQITATQAGLEELRSRLYGGTSNVPAAKAESFIIERLDRISERRTVELVSVKPGAAKEVLMFDELAYEVEIKGDFFELVAWLQELEEELRPMVVKEFNMRPEQQDGRVAMRLRVASYRPSGERL